MSKAPKGRLLPKKTIPILKMFLPFVVTAQTTIGAQQKNNNKSKMHYNIQKLNEKIRVKETKRKAVTILLSDQTPPNNKYHYWIPMTPQANLSPVLPVFRLSSVPPFPRSSVPLCTTRARPITLCGPCSEMILSVILMVATPVGPASTLPRSPTWRSVSLGSPWFFYKQRSHGDPITSASSACACKWEQKLQNKATRVLLCRRAS